MRFTVSGVALTRLLRGRGARSRMHVASVRILRVATHTAAVGPPAISRAEHRQHGGSLQSSRARIQFAAEEPHR